VRVYYLRRGGESPWTVAEPVRIYEGGSVEKLPDWGEAVLSLF
jgi:hypothetical protein